MAVDPSRIPDLGNIRNAPPPEAIRAMPGPFGGLARHLEEDGTYTPDKIMRNNESGQILAVPHRSDYVDAEQLVEMMREMVRKELRAFAVRMKLPIPDEE